MPPSPDNFCLIKRFQRISYFHFLNIHRSKFDRYNINVESRQNLFEKLPYIVNFIDMFRALNSTLALRFIC